MNREELIHRTMHILNWYSHKEKSILQRENGIVPSYLDTTHFILKSPCISQNIGIIHQVIKISFMMVINIFAHNNNGFLNYVKWNTIRDQ
jgi:hypothetical protein